MAKRRRRQPKVWTSDKILNDWKKAVKKGLGSKRLDPSIEAQFKAPLLAKIQNRLDPPQSRDYNVEGPSTRAVATTLGRICRLMTTEGNTVKLAVFEQAFRLCRLHPKCPTGGPGSGQWCNI